MRSLEDRSRDRPQDKMTTVTTKLQIPNNNNNNNNNIRILPALRKLRWTLILLFALNLYVDIISSTGAQAQQIPPFISKKFCGKALTEAIDLVCVNGFNDKVKGARISALTLPRKRNIDYENPLDNEIETELALAQPLVFPYLEYELSPLLSGIYRNDFLVKTSRRLRRQGGIYDECCRKSCTYSELAAYCRPS